MEFSLSVSRGVVVLCILRPCNGKDRLKCQMIMGPPRRDSRPVYKRVSRVGTQREYNASCIILYIVEFYAQSQSRREDVAFPMYNRDTGFYLNSQSLSIRT